MKNNKTKKKKQEKEIKRRIKQEKERNEIRMEGGKPGRTKSKVVEKRERQRK